MKKSLSMDEFSTFNIEIVSTMLKQLIHVSFYRKGYDTLSDDLVYQLYVGGREKYRQYIYWQMASSDDYSQHKDGIYVIEHIGRADDYTISVLGGKLQCYRI